MDPKPIVAVMPDSTELVFEPGTPDSIVNQRVREHLSGQTQTPVRSNPMLGAVTSGIRRAGAAAPAIGGFAGGLAGGGVGPASYAGAGIGGAAGEGVNQLVQSQLGDAPIGAGERAKRIAGAGAEQAGLQFVGGKVAQGAGKAATGLMRYALRQSAPSLRTFGDLAGEAITRGLRATHAGSETAGKMADQAGAAAKVAWTDAVQRVHNLIDFASASGTKITPLAMSKPVLEAAEQAAGRRLSYAERNNIIESVAQHANEVLDRAAQGVVGKDAANAATIDAAHATRLEGIARMSRVGQMEGKAPLPILQPKPLKPSTTFSPAQVDIIKKSLDNDLKPFYAARAKGMLTQPIPQEDVRLVAGAHQALNEAVPGVQEANQKVGNLIDLQKAIPTSRARGRWRMPGNIEDPSLAPKPIHPDLQPMVNEARSATGLSHALSSTAARPSPRLIPALLGGAGAVAGHSTAEHGLAGLATFLLAHAAMSPGATSGAANILARTPPDVLMQSPRLLEEAFRQFMLNMNPQLPDTTGGP